MMKDYQGDYESGYFNQMTQRALAIVKSTALFCFTLLLIGAAFLYFVFYNERFSIVGYEEGVYVFDRSNLNLSHCSNMGKCFTMTMKKSEEETPEPAAIAPAPVAQPSSTMVCVPQMIPTSQGMMSAMPSQPSSPLNLTAPATQNAVLGNGIVPSAVQQQMNIAQQQVAPAAPAPSTPGNSLFQPTAQSQWAPLPTPAAPPIPAAPAAPVIAQPVTSPPITAVPPPVAPSPMMPAAAPAQMPSPSVVPVAPSIAPQPIPSPTVSAPGASIVSAIAPGTGVLGAGENTVAVPTGEENAQPPEDAGTSGAFAPPGMEGMTSPA